MSNVEDIPENAKEDVFDDLSKSGSEVSDSPEPHDVKEVEPSDPLSSNFSERESGNSDAYQFAHAAKWHLFLRLFNVAATSTYLDCPAGERMRKFRQDHKWFFCLCLLADFLFTVVCALLTLGTLSFIFVKVTGVQFCLLGAHFPIMNDK